MHEVIVTLTQTGEVLQERARQIPKSLACMVHLAPKETRELKDLLHTKCWRVSTLNVRAHIEPQVRNCSDLRHRSLRQCGPYNHEGYHQCPHQFNRIIFDAINNSSDTLLSTITIVNTKLAHLSPDKKHPLGYGRIEYLTASAVSMIVLYAGITSLIDSIQTITAPEAPSYTTVSLTLTAVTISVKIFLDRFVKATSEKVGSDALVASGSDALFDATLSISTLATAFTYIAFGISLEA